MKLGVNVDHVATLRQARGVAYPDPVAAAQLAARAGADNVTCHLREDRRHVQDADVRRLRREVALPLNFEMAATDAMLAFAEEIIPATVTLVPERRQEVTTEGGLDCRAHAAVLGRAVRRLRDAGIAEVSLFIDPTAAAVDAARDLGAHAVEFHTGKYCEETTAEGGDRQLAGLNAAAARAIAAGLAAHAGHGLHYGNVARMREVAGLHSLQIGHAIVARAVFVGFEAAVREMKSLVS